MKDRERSYGLLGIALVVVVWMLAVPPGGVFVPALREVWDAFQDLTQRGALLRDLGDSLQRVLVGVLAAALLACTLATAAAFSRPFGYIVNGPIELLRPIPPIAWVPIAIILFGVGDPPAIAIVTLGAFFPIWLALLRGLADVRDEHLLAARSLGASELACFTRVVVPSVVPYAFHGLRLGVGLGWFCVVAAEMMGAQTGLGHAVQLFSLNLELGKTYAYLGARARCQKI